jgi:hypothetical protein
LQNQATGLPLSWYPTATVNEFGGPPFRGKLAASAALRKVIT